MNIRKNIDYSDMYAALDAAMSAEKQQMKLYCKIGKAVCQRREKGAAVAAAVYLSEHYPDAQGFSPRNLRRMRDFYRAYEDQPALLSMALQLGWTQNVVILEADLSMELRRWYLLATSRFGWSKAELIEKIATNVHEIITLEIDEDVCFEREETRRHNSTDCMEKTIRHLIRRIRCRMELFARGKRQCPKPNTIFPSLCSTNQICHFQIQDTAPT